MLVYIGTCNFVKYDHNKYFKMKDSTNFTSLFQTLDLIIVWKGHETLSTEKNQQLAVSSKCFNWFWIWLVINKRQEQIFSHNKENFNLLGNFYQK